MLVETLILHFILPRHIPLCHLSFLHNDLLMQYHFSPRKILCATLSLQRMSSCTNLSPHMCCQIPDCRYHLQDLHCLSPHTCCAPLETSRGLSYSICGDPPSSLRVRLKTPECQQASFHWIRLLEPAALQRTPVFFPWFAQKLRAVFPGRLNFLLNRTYMLSFKTNI